jgi:threonine synthase
VRRGSPFSRAVLGLACARAGHEHAVRPWRGLCDCGSPLAVRYDLPRLARRWRRGSLARRRGGLWRFREVLPLAAGVPVTDLGEGGTPLLPAMRLGRELGLARLWIKDESGNPTASFKARGMAVAVNVAVALGRTVLAVPSAGNAGSALAAYAAAAGAAAHVFMPRDTPRVFLADCRLLGARVTLVDGLITDAARALREGAAGDWTDLSTLREPYRLEGKKTLGYEIAEALGWRLPDVIVYPTGGGTGLLGMWKAFEELEALGWIEPGRRPRMVCVQAAGCAPLVRAFHAGEPSAAPWEDAQTAASGLRVPAAVADFWILRVLRDSRGTAVAVPEASLLADTLRLSRREGVVACPEGGAALAALRQLAADGWVAPDEDVVLFNTGSGLKYLEALEQALAAERVAVG